ncbi:MAG: hypothetical protein WC503_06030 [Candidatus Shapirobacteria bacterium]
MSDNLKNIKLELDKLVENEMHIASRTPNRLLFLVLQLCQEVIKLRQEYRREPRNWGNMHT